MSTDDARRGPRGRTLDQELKDAARVARRLLGSGRARVTVRPIRAKPAPDAPRALANRRTGNSGRRCFHAKLKALGGALAGIGYARYAQRLEGTRAEELARDTAGAVVGGSVDIAAFERAATLLEDAGQRRREWKAPTYGLEVELPSVFTPAQMREAMSGISSWLAGRGHPNVWGVHSHNEWSRWQPHGHVAILARDTDGQRHRPVEGGAAMMELRAAIADAVNTVAHRHGVKMAPYDPRGFKEIGVDRAPRQRLPVGPWKARDDREAGKRLSRSRRRMAEAADAYDRTVMPARQKAHEEGEPLPALPPRAGAQIRLLRELVARQEADLREGRGLRDRLDHLRKIRQAQQRLAEAERRRDWPVAGDLTYSVIPRLEGQWPEVGGRPPGWLEAVADAAAAAPALERALAEERAKPPTISTGVRLDGRADASPAELIERINRDAAMIGRLRRRETELAEAAAAVEEIRAALPPGYTGSAPQFVRERMVPAMRTMAAGSSPAGPGTPVPAPPRPASQPVPKPGPRPSTGRGRDD